MADEPTQDAATVETGQQNDQQETDETKGDVPPEVKRALAKANKEAETLRLKLKEFEDRDKSEVEKIAERAKAAEERAAKAESDLMRLFVAHNKGLTPGQAKRLVGSTKEELEADADEILAEFGAVKKAAPAAKTLKSGSTSSDQMTGKERAAAALRELRGAGR